MAWIELTGDYYLAFSSFNLGPDQVPSIETVVGHFDLIVASLVATVTVTRLFEYIIVEHKELDVENLCMLFNMTRVWLKGGKTHIINVLRKQLINPISDPVGMVCHSHQQSSIFQLGEYSHSNLTSQNRAIRLVFIWQLWYPSSNCLT